MSKFGQIKIEGGGGGDYLRLKDGETVKLRLIGDPVVFVNIYGKTNYGSVVWDYANQKARPWGYGVSILKQLQALEEDEDWGDPTNYDIKVSRTGSGPTDTEYTVNPSPNREKLDKVALEDASTINLEVAFDGAVPVVDFVKGKRPETPKAAEEHDSSPLDIPFDE